MAQPADHAPDLASSSALRIELHRREAESAGVTPHGPSAQHVGADTQTPTFESRAGLERPLTARRHRHEHDHDPRRRVDQRESTLSQRNGLQVEDLRPTGHHDQIGDSRRLHDRGSRPRGAVEDDVGDALRPSSIKDAPYPIRSDGRHDRLVSLPTVPPPTGTRLGIQIEKDGADLHCNGRRQAGLGRPAFRRDQRENPHVYKYTSLFVCLSRCIHLVARCLRLGPSPDTPVVRPPVVREKTRREELVLSRVRSRRQSLGPVESVSGDGTNHQPPQPQHPPPAPGIPLTWILVAALKTSGCELIFRDNASGGRWDRPELHKLLSQLRKGDVLVVWTLDRLSRSLRDVLTIMERVQERHAGFRSLKEAVDTTTPAGRMMMQMVGAFAEFERAMLKERTKAGLDAARKEGRIGGRPPKLKPHQQQEIVTLVKQGKKTAADAARLFGVHPATVSRLLRRT